MFTITKNFTITIEKVEIKKYMITNLKITFMKKFMIEKVEMHHINEIIIEYLLSLGIIKGICIEGLVIWHH